MAFETFFDPEPDAAGKIFRPGLSVRGGPAPGRSHESAGLVGVGMYGETFPNQDGAPVRMVVPWKYGYKSIKSIVKIRFVDKAAAHHVE